MKCEEYREVIAADPTDLSAVAAKHCATCAACDAFRRSMQELDQLLARAMKIEVPELRMPELPAPGRDSNVVKLPFSRLTAPVWFGIAASVAIAAVLGIRLLTNDIVYPSLAAEIVAHLDHERGALVVTTEAVSGERLGEVLAGHAEMTAGVGLISYARSCVIHGHTVPHLVIQGENGPVTVLLLADEMIDAAVPIEGTGIIGVILPVGKGSIAIIGERDEPIEKIEKQLVDSLHWTT
jgi:hypothetical protein